MKGWKKQKDKKEWKEEKWNCEHNLKTDEKSLSETCDFHCGAVKD